LEEEGVVEKFPAIIDCRQLAGMTTSGIPVGVGLHDSSAALIPYLSTFTDPFILLSTGTWCISLNPFNHRQLSDYELHQDCLCYLAYDGKPVKASRLFAGYEHEQQVKRLAEHFEKPVDYFKSVEPDPEFIRRHRITQVPVEASDAGDARVRESKFSMRDPGQWQNYEEAYHVLIADLAGQQLRSTNLVLKGTPVRQIFVDGGFGKNKIFMHLLARAYPSIRLFAASVPQATALGAAMTIHPHWNPGPMPRDLVDLQLYSSDLGKTAL
jgi:sugar (pentulose or hexulose) kinase